MGVKIKEKRNSIIIQKSMKLKKINVITKPFPGFLLKFVTPHDDALPQCFNSLAPVDSYSKS